MDKKKILTNSQIKRKIKRISLQIIESNVEEKEVVLAGIEKNGFLLAKELHKMITELSNLNVKLCGLTIDKKNPLNNISTSLISNEFKNK